MQPSDATRHGSYVVLSVLGQGGMATVYRVRHEVLGSLHALKVLSAPDAEVALRLQQEGRLQATLRHPNVVRVTDAVLVDGQPGLVMELVEGPSLAQLLDTQRLTLDEADHLAAGILEGVAAAHRQGWVHRDLKPANVLLQVSGDTLVPKVADFGLAKVLEGHRAEELASSPHTPHGHVLGTLRYMAPEQFRQEHVDQRADVFALGSLLYALVIGRPPFESGSLEQCLRAVTTGSYPDPDELRPDLPERMARAIRAALATDPDDRPADAGALLELWRGAGTRPAFRPEVLQSARLARDPVARSGSTLTVAPVRRRSLAPVLGIAAGTVLVLGTSLALVQAPEPEPMALVVPDPEPDFEPPPPPVTVAAAVAPEPAEPAPKALPAATLIVNTWGGTAGDFAVGDGPRLRVGPKRRQELPAGRHRVRIWPHQGPEPVFDRVVELGAGERRVVCWDLKTRAPCDG